MSPEQQPATYDQTSQGPRHGTVSPVPLPPELIEAPALPPGLLPEPLHPWLYDIAERMQIPLEFVAAPAVVALSSVIGRSGIYPTSLAHWTAASRMTAFFSASKWRSGPRLVANGRMWTAIPTPRPRTWRSSYSRRWTSLIRSLSVPLQKKVRFQHSASRKMLRAYSMNIAPGWNCGFAAANSRIPRPSRATLPSTAASCRRWR